MTGNDVEAPADGRFDGLVDRIDAAQRRVPAVAFPLAVLRKFTNDRGGKLAAVLAYYAFLSIFPLLLVATAVLGRVLAGNADLQRRLLDSALSQFPVIGAQLTQAQELKASSLVAFVVGVIGALFGGLRAMQVAQDAMNDVWNISRRERPNFVRLRARALLVLVAIGGMLIASVVLSAAATQVPLALFGRLALVLGSVGANIVTFLLAFQILTIQRQPWRDLLPGAIGAGIAWWLLQILGAWFVDRALRNATEVYGTFASVIGLLALFHLQAMVTLIAAEVNVVLARRLWPRSLTGRNLTDADRRAALDEATASIDLPGASVDVRFDDRTSDETGLIPSHDDPHQAGR